MIERHVLMAVEKSEADEIGIIHWLLSNTFSMISITKMVSLNRNNNIKWEKFELWLIFSHVDLWNQRRSTLIALKAISILFNMSIKHGILIQLENLFFFSPCKYSSFTTRIDSSQRYFMPSSVFCFAVKKDFQYAFNQYASILWMFWIPRKKTHTCV